MKYEKTFGYPALELFHCLPISKSAVCQLHCLTPLFLLATSVENSEATWEKATKCNKVCTVWGLSLTSRSGTEAKSPNYLTANIFESGPMPTP